MIIIGQKLSDAIGVLEQHNQRWFVTRHNEYTIERPKAYNTYMLEVDDGIITTFHYLWNDITGDTNE